jgi:hypothetical protein
MSPGSINRAIVADKVGAVRRMLDGIQSLPLDDLGAFTRDPRMVAAADSYLRRALEALLAGQARPWRFSRSAFQGNCSYNCPWTRARWRSSRAGTASGCWSGSGRR